MERKALDRKPNLSVRKTFRLDEDTEISEIGMTVRKQVELSNNKSLSDTDRGIHLMAAKILVNGNRVIYDDLMDCFSSEETILRRFESCSRIILSWLSLAVRSFWVLSRSSVLMRISSSYLPI